MVKLNIDFIGPFNTAEESGYVRWVELFPCEFADAEETANALLMHFGRYGAPSVMLSDRGSHFVNSVISEFLLHVGTEHSLLQTREQLNESSTPITQKDFQRLVDAPYPFSGFTVDSDVLLEPVTGPKGRLHTRRLGQFQVIGNKGNSYTLLNESQRKN